jgi:sec-independent protein translocase protein TatA
MMPGGWEWLIIIVVLLLLFGAKRLPEMARSVGQSARVFKGEMKGLRDEDGRPAQGTAQGTAQPDARPAAPAAPQALPPAQQVNSQPVNGQAAGTSQAGAHEQPAEPTRPDADR